MRLVISLNSLQQGLAAIDVKLDGRSQKNGKSSNDTGAVFFTSMQLHTFQTQSFPGVITVRL